MPIRFNRTPGQRLPRRVHGEDQPPHMWSYWKNKYGTLKALKDYYPNLARDNLLLSNAVAQMESAEIVIESIMRKREDENLNPYE